MKQKINTIYFFVLFAIYLFCSPILYGQTFHWVKSMGGPAAETGLGVDIDRNGNVYVTGAFQATADFNPGGSGGVLTSTSSGSYDVYLAKYDKESNFLWAKSMGGNNSDVAQDLALDTNGNIYVTGSFHGIADFNLGGNGGSITSSGGSDIFLIKYDSDGNFLWAKGIGGKDDDGGEGVAVDRNGNVYVSGGFYSDIIDFPGNNGASLINSGEQNAFLIKYDSNGNFLWGKAIGGEKYDNARDVAVDNNNNVYIAGEFESTQANFNNGGNGGTLNSLGSTDAFLAKYDSEGNYIWAKNMGGTSIDQGFDLALDNDGNSYISGGFRSATADFNIGGNGGILTSAGSTDIFLAKYDTAGNYIWAKNIGGMSTDNGRGVAVDGRGYVYITGFFQSDTINFNIGKEDKLLATAGRNDAFLAKYDADGNYIWAKNMGGPLQDYGWDVAVDDNGTVYMTGRYTGVGDFNAGDSTGTVYAVGQADAFVVKFGCDTSSSHLEVSLCEDTYTLNDSIYTASGVYTQLFPNLLGCDSILTLTLSLNGLVKKPLIVVNEKTLSTSEEFHTYQWIKDGSVIAGATEKEYQVSENGEYQVEVSNEYGCAEISDPYTVNNATSVHAIENSKIVIAPNPTQDIINIHTQAKTNIVLTTIDGRMIFQKEDTKNISLKDIPDGIYLLTIYDANNHQLLKTEKVVKY